MNLLFLIGSGFDINIGLETSFSNILNFYTQNHIPALQNDKSYVKKFKQEISNNIKLWSDFEKKLGEYTENFSNNNIDEFIDCYNDFLRALNCYLDSKQNLNFNIDIYSKQEELTRGFLHSIKHFYKQITIGSPEKTKSLIGFNDITCDFIIFNYTDVFENCINAISMKELEQNKIHFHKYSQNLIELDSMLYVHGKIGNGVILGVNDKQQLNNIELRNDDKLIKTLVKPVINSELLKNVYGTGKLKIIRSDIICIFGMSIGETDAVWWEMISDWLESSEEHIFIMFVHDENISAANPNETRTAADRIIDNFFFEKSPDKKSRLKKQIYFVFNTDLFKIDLRRKN